MIGWAPPCISHKVRPFGRGPTTRSLGDLRSPWLLTTYPSPGMILQVDLRWWSKIVWLDHWIWPNGSKWNHISPTWISLKYFTWSFQLQKNNRRFIFFAVSCVFLRAFARFLRAFCGFLRSFFWVSWFAGFCGRLRPKLGKHPKLPEISSRWKLQVVFKTLCKDRCQRITKHLLRFGPYRYLDNFGKTRDEEISLPKSYILWGKKVVWGRERICPDWI